MLGIEVTIVKVIGYRIGLNRYKKYISLYKI